MRVVPALDRGLEILQYVGQATGPVKAPELVRELKIPRTAVYELINTLHERDFVEQHSDGTITLGVALFTLGGRYAELLDPAREAQSVAHSLMKECDETVQIGVLRGRNVLYIARADPNRMVRLVSAVGRQIPAHATAIGKALLAHLEDSELDQLFEEVHLETLTTQTIADVDELRRQLTEVRQTGIAYDNGESNLEVTCLAVPVIDIRGHCVAAISVSTTLGRMTPERSLELTGLVRNAASRLAARVGYGATL